MRKKGKLIVIDGGDGSGKQTQSELLINFLKKANIKVNYFDFPRYSTFYGKIVGHFLNGDFGDISQVSPYLVSLPYAFDRGQVALVMKNFIKKGGIIICNRYATSNMAHQGAKLPLKERSRFIRFIEKLEYQENNLPQEDLVIYLYVPWQVGWELTIKKSQRRYLKGKVLDIHEADAQYRVKTEKMYLWLCQKRKNWLKVNCVDKNEKMKSKEAIHQEIIKILKQKKIVNN